MDVFCRIDRMLRKSSAHPAAENIKLYAEGVKEKLKQADYAISRMQSLETMEQYEAATGSTNLLGDGQRDISVQISFYCDCFWDILWSALDIMSQLINAARGLGLTEKQINFARVCGILEQRHQTDPLTRRVKQLKNSRALRNLTEYRHCSTHRRPIYIQTRVTTTSFIGRPGYSQSTETTNRLIRRYLCDNPADLVPTVSNREMVPFCLRIKRQLEKQISRVINQIL